MPLFFITLLTCYLAGNLYVFLEGRRALAGLPAGAKVFLACAYWVGALLFFVLFFLRDMKWPAGGAHALQWLGTGWLVFTLYMCLCLFACTLLRWCGVQLGSSGFLLSFALTIALLTMGYFHYRHPQTRVVRLTIDKPLTDTPPQKSPLRVVAVSDLHLGYGTDKPMLQAYVRRIQAERPDLILIGGDLVDNSVVPLYAERMEEELSKLHAPLGVYMVPGNHEYISGIADAAAFIRRTPIVLLRDSVVTLPNGIQLVGRDDRSNRRRLPVSDLLHGVDASRPILLLDHQPYDLHLAAATGIDLQFSGHTHRGQVWPMSWVTDRLFELSHGYKQIDGSHFYVSSGLSLWGPPFRIGTDSELVVFELTFK